MLTEIFYQASLDPLHTYTVTMSYIQVYMEMIQDLLHPDHDNLVSNSLRIPPCLHPLSIPLG
jgi:hypothetical protein